MFLLSRLARDRVVGGQTARSLCVVCPGVDSELMAPRRRRLRRNASREALPVEVAAVKCVRGGKRKRWMVLDTVTHLGYECVCLSSRHPWLHLLLAGQLHRSAFHGAINNFVRDCRVAARRQWRGNSSESLSQAAETAASSQVSEVPTRSM